MKSNKNLKSLESSTSFVQKISESKNVISEGPLSIFAGKKFFYIGCFNKNIFVSQEFYIIVLDKYTYKEISKIYTF